ncbi:DUF6438 domain-containing protein [Neolewinella persica]|uniref:DUF6438 domain-containing protein n=1 Tax=Neolewinella persica TaxID=70998 RepID=UPI0003826F07|nr:DUF6438 domain-containing protein [Neolewinella persica]
MKSPYLLLPLLFFTLFSITSCDPSALLGPQAGNADKYDLRVSYHRGSCYGRCEVYTLDLYDNGLLLFQGERFTERPGTWQKNIDRRRIVALLDSFQRADFQNYPRSFRGEIPDATTVSFTYYDAEGNAFQTSFKDVAPKELQDLDQAMIKLSQLSGYRQVSETITDKTAVPVGNREREEIIVQLKDGVVAETWVIAYGKQNVKIKNRISPNSPYYVVTADPNIMGGDELLEFLRKDESVVSAQLNKQVSPR